MKKNKKKVLVILLLLVFGITAGYIANTFAKYTAEVNGQGSATVAKWAFASDNASTDFTISLAETYDASTLVSGKIAPGTSGSFDIELSNVNSEVGVSFTIAFTETSNVPSNLVFKQNGVTVDPTNGTITGKIAAGETLTVPLTWEWAYSTSTANDALDTTDGENGNTMTVKAKITGVQVAPSTTAVTTGIDQ